MNIVEMYNETLTLKPGDYVRIYDVGNDSFRSAYSTPKIGYAYKIYKISNCTVSSQPGSFPSTPEECHSCRTNHKVIYLEDPDDRNSPICGCYFKMKTVTGIDVNFILQNMERR